MISEITPNEVILGCRTTLGLPSDKAVLDDFLLIGLLRRCAGMLCPCSGTALRAALIESLNHLHDDNDALASRLDRLINDLMVCGDLLELPEVTIDDSHMKGAWVFAAPPSYVVRRSKSIFLIGIVSDQDAFLPEAISARVRYDGCARLIIPEPKEDLESVLTAQGLQRLSEGAWLKAPKKQKAEGLVGDCKQSLMAQSDSGKIEGLEILDSVKKVTYYRGRWASPVDQTGTFVARRPHEFGARIWSFVQLENGVPQRLIDLPPADFRWRGCDAAWHLQMAIDCCRGQPQLYRRRNTEKGVRFDFFSPLPQWFERRLLIFGQSLPPEKCLISYELLRQEADDEEQSLQEELWLAPAEDQQGKM